MLRQKKRGKGCRKSREAVGWCESASRVDVVSLVQTPMQPKDCPDAASGVANMNLQQMLLGWALLDERDRNRALGCC